MRRSARREGRTSRLRWIGRLVATLVILVGLVAGLGAVVLYQSDVPRAELVARYGGPDSRFVRLISGTVAHYRDRGPSDAPVVVLLHGSNASLHTWEPWVAILKDRFRVVTVDLPAHGLTGAVPGEDYGQRAMAAFVLEFAAALNLDTFALGGNSMGGGVAARFAIENPGRATRLILVDAAGLPSATPRDPGLGFRLMEWPLVRDLIPYLGSRVIFESSLKTAIPDDALVTPEMVDRYWLLNRMEGTRQATMRRFQTPRDETLLKRAGEIAVPTLILWGDQDTLIPVDVAKRWHETVKGSQVIVYPGIGHIPMEEHAAASAEDVRRFLNEAP